MFTSANPTVPPPTWSFGESSAGQEDTSAKASTQDSTNSNVPPQTLSFDDDPSHQTNTSPEQSPPLGKESDSASDADEAETADAAEKHADAADTPSEPASQQPDLRRYRARTCRICFDEVPPSFEPILAGTQLLGRNPRVVYVSDDPDAGRLMRPCKCKGTQQYVHEGCLKAWRTASAADRNLWQCPTCLYEYRLNRLSWGAWINSKVFRMVLTLLILLVTVFVLGFVADPILRYTDPIGMMASYVEIFEEYEDVDDWLPDQPNTWTSHFTKGFVALGFMGMLKTVALSRPWQFARAAGGGRRRGGRDRLENVGLLLVLMGVATFLMTVWKVTNRISAQVLDRFSDSIVDVAGDDDEGDDMGMTEPQRDQPQADTSPSVDGQPLADGPPSTDAPTTAESKKNQ